MTRHLWHLQGIVVISRISKSLIANNSRNRQDSPQNNVQPCIHIAYPAIHRLTMKSSQFKNIKVWELLQFQMYLNVTKGTKVLSNRRGRFILRNIWRKTTMENIWEKKFSKLNKLWREYALRMINIKLLDLKRPTRCFSTLMRWLRLKLLATEKPVHV